MNVPSPPFTARRSVGILGAALLVLSTPVQAAQVSLKKVVDTTDDADVPSPPAQFSAMRAGFISDSEQVIIEADASAGSGRGVWLGTVGDPLSRVLIEGETIPGGGDSFDANNQTLLLSETGKVAVLNRLASATTGIFTKTPAGLTTRVIVVGDPAPNATPETIDVLSNFGVALNDSDDLVYWAEVSGDNNFDTGIWAEDGTILVREGAATTIVGVTYGDIAQEISLNDSGDLVFSSTLRGAVTSDTNEALFAGNPGTAGEPSVVVREGDLAPGFPPATPPDDDVVFFRPAQGSINDAGFVAFSTTLKGTGISSGSARSGGNDNALYTNSGGTLALIAQEGTVALGFGDATLIYNQFSHPILCNNGDVVFEASVTRSSGPVPPATENEAIYRFTPGTGLSLVAREGGVPPDIPGTATFVGLPTFAVSDSGRIAFRGNIAGDTVTFLNNHGLWVDEGTGPELVVRESDTFLLPLVGSQTITDISLSPRIDGGAGGRPSALPTENVLMKIAYGTESGYFTFGPPVYDIIAVSGMDAPGTSPVEQFESIRPIATMAADGRVVFRAWVDDTSPPRDKQGIWYEEPGALPDDPFVLTKIAKQGDPAPGQGGAVYENMTRLPAWNDAGDAAFMSSLRYDFGLGINKFNTFRLWQDPAGTTGPEVKVSAGVSGIVGASIASAAIQETSRRAPPMNSSNQMPYTVIFRKQAGPNPPPPAGTITNLNRSAIGAWDGLINKIIAQEGETDSLSTVTPGAKFDYLINNSELFISDSGLFIFEGKLRGVAPVNEVGLWVADASTGALLPPIAQGGLVAQGTGGGLYLDPVQPAMSRKPLGAGGTPVVFRSTLQGAGITFANDIAVFYTPAAGFTAPGAIAQTGTGIAPGTAEQFLDFTPPMMNHSGQIIMRAYTATRGGIWSSLASGDPNTLNLEVIEGDPAPDISGASFVGFDPPIAGDGGHVAFVGSVSGGTVGAANDSGIWARAPGDVYRLIIREGLSLEVMPGVVLTIGNVDDANNIPFQVGGYNKGDRPQQMVNINAAGQFVFWAEFTNGDSAVIRVQL